MGVFAGVAFAMLASSLWMAIGPQLPQFRSRRRVLAWLTWLASRAAAAALLLQSPAPGRAFHGLPAVAGSGFLPGGLRGAPAMGPMDLSPQGGWLILFVIAADFVTWRALAAAEGDDGEAAWNWVASPLALWVGVVFGAPRGAAVALVALAHLLQRRGSGAASGFALGAAAAWGGPAALAVALALVLASGRSFVRALCAGAAGAAVFLGLLLVAPAAWGWAWLAPAEPGGGVTAWRLVRAATGFVPGTWAWLAVLALLLGGFARLVPRGATAPALAAWAFGACAVFAPSFPVRDALPFAPLLAVWAADDPDRRGWWFLEALALALCVVLESLAVHEGSRATWRLIGLAGIGGTTLLALWPLRATAVPAPAVAPASSRA